MPHYDIVVDTTFSERRRLHFDGIEADSELAAVTRILEKAVRPTYINYDGGETFYPHYTSGAWQIKELKPPTMFKVNVAVTKSFIDQYTYYVEAESHEDAIQIIQDNDPNPDEIKGISGLESFEMQDPKLWYVTPVKEES